MIVEEYYKIVQDLAERAKLIITEGETDKMEAVYQAMDEGFIYSYDEAIVLAHAYLEGYISLRSGTLDWDTVLENLMDDINTHLLSIDK